MLAKFQVAPYILSRLLSLPVIQFIFRSLLPKMPMQEASAPSPSSSPPCVPGLPLGALLWSLLVWCPVQAQETDWASNPPPPAFKMSGFATLGLTHHHNDDAGMVFSFDQKSLARSGVSGNLDSVLGLQLNWQAGESTSAVLQMVGRAGENMDPKLRMGYLRQQWGPDVAVRVGRYRSPLYFDSDVTEIGYANMTVRPPLPVYWIANSVIAIDGADVQWRHHTGNAAWLLQAYAGSSSYKIRFNSMNPVIASDNEVTGLKGLAASVALPHVTLRASRTWVDSTTLRSSQVDRLNAGLAQMAGGLSALAANPMLPGALRAGLGSKAQATLGYINPFDSTPIYTSVGFNANWDGWTMLGEWARFASGSGMLGSADSYHLTLGRSVGNFTPYIGLARQQRKTPALDTTGLGPTGLNPQLDGGLAQLKGALDDAATGTNKSSHSATVGVRWDFADNMALKLQYDRFKTPSPYHPGPFANFKPLPIDNRVHLVSVVLDVVF